MTPYQPFEYRAPELLLWRRKYTHAIDMWAFGVMLYEFTSGKQLFSGESSAKFIRSLINVIGYPPLKMMRGSPLARKLFGQNPKKRPDDEVRPIVNISDKKLQNLIMSCL